MKLLHTRHSGNSYNNKKSFSISQYKLIYKRFQLFPRLTFLVLRILSEISNTWVLHNNYSALSNNYEKSKIEIIDKVKTKLLMCGQKKVKFLSTICQRFPFVLWAVSLFFVNNLFLTSLRKSFYLENIKDKITFTAEKFQYNNQISPTVWHLITV